MALKLARENNLFTSLAPHFCLARAQFAHLLGRDQAASKAYDACLALLVPGSEMGLVIEICSLACQGGLSGLLQDDARAAQVRNLADRCRTSSNASIAATGHFLASLLEPNRIASK